MPIKRFTSWVRRKMPNFQSKHPPVVRGRLPEQLQDIEVEKSDAERREALKARLGGKRQ